MSLTPNYGFNIPTGTDAVNLLTQNYPNFTSLDSILKTIELTGITTATCTKVGTVFQLVRTNSALNVIRFVATGNYAAGDTFTIDGVPVTATAVDGSSIPGGAFVINQSVMAILNGSVFTVLVSSGASTASGITYDNTGSGLAATNVQDAIDEVKADIPSIPATYDADDIVYNNTGSGLTATNVQDAIDEISINNHVSVTADGVKTFSQVLNELWALIDFSKVTHKTKLIQYRPDMTPVSNDYWNICRSTSTVLTFSRSELASSYTLQYTAEIEVMQVSSTFRTKIEQNTMTNNSSNTAPLGTIFTIYY